MLWRSLNLWLTAIRPAVQREAADGGINHQDCAASECVWSLENDIKITIPAVAGLHFDVLISSAENDSMRPTKNRPRRIAAATITRAAIEIRGRGDTGGILQPDKLPASQNAAEGQCQIAAEAGVKLCHDCIKVRLAKTAIIRHVAVHRTQNKVPYRRGE